jgi:fused signal recognition particle receptor
MSFFKKLKDRMFRSSSKIDEGLDAIVADGGAEEIVGDQVVDQAAEQERAAAEVAEQERVAAEEEKQRLEAAEQERQAAAEAERVAALEVAEAARLEAVAKAEQAAEAARQETAAKVEKAAAEAQRIAAENEAAKAQVENAAQLAALEAAQKQADAAAAREAEQIAAEETARLAAAEDARVQAEEAAKAAAEEARIQAEETARLAEDAAQAEAEAAAELAAQAALVEAEAAAKVVEPGIELSQTFAPIAPLLQDEVSDEPQKKAGLLGRLFGGKEQKTVVRRTLDDDMLEQLEELLISADMGVDTALRVTANMAEGRLGKKLSVAEIKGLMAAEVARIMEPVARPMPLYAHKPQVVLVVGVNGSGKTTTIGKLASQFKAAGKNVVIAAGDTFRAAAVEQLQVWGERAGVPVLTAPEGSDPASLAFDAMTKAQEDGADLLMIDTAGRLHNRADLMEELTKIVRVIRKKDPEAPHNTLLVLDATTGQNALQQVKVFQELADVSGLVMTKLDGTAKGGVLVALADKFGLPIHAIGVGEQIDDLAPFDPEDFANALVGVETE